MHLQRKGSRRFDLSAPVPLKPERPLFLSCFLLFPFAFFYFPSSKDAVIVNGALSLYGPDSIIYCLVD